MAESNNRSITITKNCKNCIHRAVCAHKDEHEELDKMVSDILKGHSLLFKMEVACNYYCNDSIMFSRTQDALNRIAGI